jgi:DNA-binding response OmpR family regulator
MIKRILIAEDNYYFRDALTQLAAREGFDVIAVDSGTELLSIANSSKFDLIITDLIMPGSDVAYVTETLKQRGDTTPIIAVTGLSSLDVEWVKTEFIKIFYKPINADELFKYIRNLKS